MTRKTTMLTSSMIKTKMSLNNGTQPVCRVCSEPFSKGDTIHTVGGKKTKWYHILCARKKNIL